MGRFKKTQDLAFISGPAFSIRCVAGLMLICLFMGGREALANAPTTSERNYDQDSGLNPLLDHEFRQTLSSLEYKARFIKGSLQSRPLEVICFELGGLKQTQVDFRRKYWDYSLKFRGLKRIGDQVGDLASQTESAMRYCYGQSGIVLNPKNTKKVPKGDSEALSDVLAKIENLAEEMKSRLDEMKKQGESSLIL